MTDHTTSRCYCYFYCISTYHLKAPVLGKVQMSKVLIAAALITHQIVNS